MPWMAPPGEDDAATYTVPYTPAHDDDASYTASQEHWSATEPPADLAARRRQWRQYEDANYRADVDAYHPPLPPARRSAARGADRGDRDGYDASIASHGSIYVASAAYGAATAVVGKVAPAGASSRRVAASGAGSGGGGSRAPPGPFDSEGLSAQVRTLKKELASSRAENKLLRVSKERAEAELRKAEHTGEEALRTAAIVDASGSAGVRPEARLLRQLKAKTRELQGEIQNKDAQVLWIWAVRARHGTRSAHADADAVVAPACVCSLAIAHLRSPRPSPARRVSSRETRGTRARPDGHERARA